MSSGDREHEHKSIKKSIEYIEMGPSEIGEIFSFVKLMVVQ